MVATTSRKQRVSVRSLIILFLTDKNSNELKGHDENVQMSRCTALAMMNCTGLQAAQISTSIQA